jgi:uncharacterized protein (DUF488 family)
MSTSLRAYSLGYEGISLDRYVEVLKSHQISLVIDVRETPWSYKPGFSKKPLSERLESEQISYIHLKAAGNPSKNRKMGLPQQQVIQLYKEHLESEPSCLETIYGLIREKHRQGAVCLLCFEEKPHDCHRKVILDTLAEQTGTLITCHLNAGAFGSEKPVTAQRVPKPYDRKRLRKHVEVPKNQRRLVSV